MQISEHLEKPLPFNMDLSKLILLCTMHPFPQKSRYSRLSVYRTRLIQSLAYVEQMSESRQVAVIKYSN